VDSLTTFKWVHPPFLVVSLITYEFTHPSCGFIHHFLWFHLPLLVASFTTFCEFTNLFFGFTYNRRWQSHRNRNRIAPFFPKNRIYKSHRNPQKHRICYRISKLNKNNLRLLRLFRFFNKLSMVLYLVVSCDCFVIIMFLGKEKFELAYDLLHHSTFLHTT